MGEAIESNGSVSRHRHFSPAESCITLRGVTDMPKRHRLRILKEPQPPWYEKGLHFSCTQCGNCCSGGPGYVWVSDRDILAISEFLGLAVEDFARRYLRQLTGGISLTEHPNYDCIFLQRSGGKALCKIYPVRPTQCRTWPFWKQNIESEEHWHHAARRCPGMQAATGPLYDAAHIERCANDPESP
jgi:Fe-S-cluster containining protein